MTSEVLSTGGPAFPRPMSADDHSGPRSVSPDQEGMTLRDAFALAIAPALVRELELVRTLNPDARDHDRDMKIFGEGAYRLADAMLRAREVKNV